MKKSLRPQALPYKSRHHFQRHLLSHSKEENESYIKLMQNQPPRAPAIDLVMPPVAMSKGLPFYKDYQGFEAPTSPKDYLKGDEPDKQTMDTISLLFGLFGGKVETKEDKKEMATAISRSICKPETGSTMVKLLQTHFDD